MTLFELEIWLRPENISHQLKLAQKGIVQSKAGN